jgi:energy-coupling factor transporter ATP-binding protein EcfA2
MAGLHGHRMALRSHLPRIGRPSILLADEPTGNLDSRNGEAVMELLQNLHREGATLCMVTHDPRFAKHAQREVHLFDGRVVAEEEPKTSLGERRRTSGLDTGPANPFIGKRPAIARNPSRFSSCSWDRRPGSHLVFPVSSYLLSEVIAYLGILRMIWH